MIYLRDLKEIRIIIKILNITRINNNQKKLPINLIILIKLHLNILLMYLL